MTKVPNILLIGAGRFGTQHLRVLKDLEKENKIILKGVVTKSGENNINSVKNYTKLSKELLEDVDGVDIVTPASTHHLIAKECLKYANVMCEKPLALSSEDINDMINTSKKHNKFLMVGHIFRFNDAIKELKEVVNENKNNLVEIEGSLTGQGKMSDDCGALETFMHMFDIFNDILGMMPKNVECKAKYEQGKEFESYADVNLEYPNNLTGKIHIGWTDEDKKRILFLRFKDKEVTCDLLSQTVEIKKGNNITTKTYFKEEPLKTELITFIKILNGEKLQYPDGESALKVQRIIEASKKSEKTGRKVTL